MAARPRAGAATRGRTRSSAGSKRRTRADRSLGKAEPVSSAKRRGLTPDVALAWIRANEELAIIASFCIGILIGAYMED